MKRPARKNRKVALALTWDGARCPRRFLAARAKAFLGRTSQKEPSPEEVAALLESDLIGELRICWVPRLWGGEQTLCAPFARADRRIAFVAGKITKLPGNCLGVSYRRSKSIGRG